MPYCGSRGHEWHDPQRGTFVRGAVGEAVRRAAMSGDGVVDGDSWVRAGGLYPIVGAVADFLAGLGRVACQGCSVALWNRKTTEGWKQLRVIGAGGPLRS